MRWKDGRRSDNIEDRRGTLGRLWAELGQQARIELNATRSKLPKAKKLSTLTQAIPGMPSDNERLRSMTKEYAKGGKVGGRGDGCCTKGKTKGKLR